MKMLGWYVNEQQQNDLRVATAETPLPGPRRTSGRRLRAALDSEQSPTDETAM